MTTNRENIVSALILDAEVGGTFCLTVCPDHGTKSCDYASGGHYVELIREFDAVEGGGHEWRCCAEMQIDPRGSFDY